MKNTRRTPINNLLKQYDINKTDLENIAIRLKEQSNEILTIDELIDLERKINNRFINTLGSQPFSKISLETIDVDPNRILNTLKLMIGEEKQRPTSETSLGINNILFISLILLSLEDRTIPTLLKKELYDQLINENESDILIECYQQSDKGNYFLKDDLDKHALTKLYTFMDNFHSANEGFTILAIEEPEAHLHPTFQRIIYKDVMKNNTSVLMTTHSPYITSVAPLNSIVHLRSSHEGTVINTTATLDLTNGERQDLERYIDVKRGELYFGKGVILIEGIAEEYLIPSFAEILGKPLDLKGIICCNINSTNFKPYIKYLDLLGIPYVGITDGDYYIEVKEKEDGEETKRQYHIMEDESHSELGYLGNERIGDLLVELQKTDSSSIPENFNEQNKLFSQYGFFVGKYTIEVDIMEACSKSKEGKNIICSIFNDLTTGGDRQKANFKKELDSGDYWACLRKIENGDNGIGKGRYAQRLSQVCRKDHIPSYIKRAIDSIFNKIDEVK